MGLSTKQVPGDKVVQFEAAELSKPPPPPPMRRQQQQSEVSKCPRCESTNTKFCYYNNYNKSQPRHFCKSCKRHWTKGGTLRNVPLGGGRKNKRPKISNTATKTVATTTTTHDDHKTAPSSVLYEPLIMGSSNNGMINTTNSTSFNTEFQYFSSVCSNIDSCNASLFPFSYDSLNVYDQYSCNLDSMEESTITTANIPTTSNVAWPGPDNSGTMDLSNYWDWSEIDVITSSDHFNNMSWDDHEEDNGGAKIKP